jgi:hypothetical protein
MGEMGKRLQCISPVSALYAVAEQPNQVLVANTADRFDLHLELLLGLAPGKKGRRK